MVPFMKSPEKANLKRLQVSGHLGHGVGVVMAQGTFEQMGTREVLGVTEMLTNWIVLMIHNSTHLLKSLSCMLKSSEFYGT